MFNTSTQVYKNDSKIEVNIMILKSMHMLIFIWFLQLQKPSRLQCGHFSQQKQRWKLLEGDLCNICNKINYIKSTISKCRDCYKKKHKKTMVSMRTKEKYPGARMFCAKEDYWPITTGSRDKNTRLCTITCLLKCG